MYKFVSQVVGANEAYCKKNNNFNKRKHYVLEAAWKHMAAFCLMECPCVLEENGFGPLLRILIGPERQ